MSEKINPCYITKIQIEHVRHLRDISIPVYKKKFPEKCQHLMLTGKNGSGKTSIIEALEKTLKRFSTLDSTQTIKLEGNLHLRGIIPNEDTGISLEIHNINILSDLISQGNFILAYYADEREYIVANEKHVSKVQFKPQYKIQEHPGKDFVKYLLDLKSTAAMAVVAGKQERATAIQKWFVTFDSILQRIFDNPKVHLAFDIDTYEFTIIEPGKEPFSFDTLSRGYAAILDIVTDLMMRMENKTTNQYDLPGIVLIDEIETHLHIALQKKIMPILTTMFPNIQFIVTTHSPFVLNSIKDAVIYDLENHILVQDDVGLSNIPYEGIIEGYFKASTLSDELKKKYNQYKQLVHKKELTDDDYATLSKLEFYLDDIPDYLAIDFMADYKQLKLELEARP